MSEAAKKQYILIPYQDFIHIHGSNKESMEDFENYTIDKTKYRTFGIELFGDAVFETIKDECLMYNTPQVKSIDFDYKDGIYTIEVETDNRQTWIYKFKGINSTTGLLIDKEILIRAN